MFIFQQFNTVETEWFTRFQSAARFIAPNLTFGKLASNVACQQLLYQIVRSRMMFKRQAIKIMIVKRLQIMDTLD